MKLFCALLGLMVTLQQSHTAAGAAYGTGTQVIAAVADSGSKLEDLVKILSNRFIKPITAHVDVKIKQINTDITGVTSEEKKMVKDAQLYLSRIDLTHTKGVLLQFANEIIKHTGSLKVIPLKLVPTQTTAEKKKGIKALGAKMKEMLERAKVLLKEAKDQYQSVVTKLIVVKAKLDLFAKRVIQLRNPHGRRYIEYAKKQRTIIYARAAACIVIPVTCPAVYAACAAALETKLTMYRNKAAQLNSQAKASGAEATKLVNKCTEDLAVMTTGVLLIEQWESQVKNLYDAFLKGDYIKNSIEIDEHIRDTSVIKLVDLLFAANDLSMIMNGNHSG